VPLDQLKSSPAIALFVDRACTVRPDFALTEDNAPAVVEICRRVDGVPLAIELAAARTRLLDPDSLLRRLTESLDAVGTGTVDMPERHQTLRATVEWSVGLLDDAERSLLETMAVFVDGWTIEAATDVAGIDDDKALDLTDELARHSLIYLDVTNAGPRSRMLGTIREFVTEGLASRPDAADVRRRHAEHYQALVEQADQPLRSTEQREWIERLQTEAVAPGGGVDLADRRRLRRRPRAGLGRAHAAWSPGRAVLDRDGVHHRRHDRAVRRAPRPSAASPNRGARSCRATR
jgi:predicted ATPase